MQIKSRRTQQERTDSTRAALIAAARESFVENGFSATTTPDLVDKAKVTRGALYHHFADKRELFVAVIEAEHAALAQDIETATRGNCDAMQALVSGGRAYFLSMREPGRTRLLLVQAPAILTREEQDVIDERHGGRTLREGLELAIRQGLVKPMPVAALSYVLSGVYDRAALAIENGASRDDVEAVMDAMIEGLLVGRSAS